MHDDDYAVRMLHAAATAARARASNKKIDPIKLDHSNTHNNRFFRCNCHVSTFLSVTSGSSTT